MKYFFPLLVFLIGCSTQPKSILTDHSTADLQKIFEDENANGCFVIYDLKNETKLEYNSARLDSTFLPASTFKIINSMIALETRVLQDEKEIIKWDSTDRGYDKWNRDQNLEIGIKYSAVWFYQELARRIGQEKMQHWVTATNYGNNNINGGIDVFWLSGDIRITPNQQIDFLKRLYFNELPFSKRNQEIVKKILIVEETPNYTIRAKTGWAARVPRQIGWYVGYLEKGEDVYFFVINMDIKSSDDPPKRKRIVKRIFKNLKLTE